MALGLPIQLLDGIGTAELSKSDDTEQLIKIVFSDDFDGNNTITDAVHLSLVRTYNYLTKNRQAVSVYLPVDFYLQLISYLLFHWTIDRDTAIDYCIDAVKVAKIKLDYFTRIKQVLNYSGYATKQYGQFINESNPLVYAFALDLKNNLKNNNANLKDLIDNSTPDEQAFLSNLLNSVGVNINNINGLGDDLLVYDAADEGTDTYDYSADNTTPDTSSSIDWTKAITTANAAFPLFTNIWNTIKKPVPTTNQTPTPYNPVIIPNGNVTPPAKTDYTLPIVIGGVVLIGGGVGIYFLTKPKSKKR